MEVGKGDDYSRGVDHHAVRRVVHAITGNRRRDRMAVLEALEALGVGAQELAENIQLWMSSGNAAAAAAARHDYMKLTGVFAPEQTEEVNKFSDVPPDELVSITLKILEDAGVVERGEDGRWRAVMEARLRVGGMLVDKGSLPPPRADEDEIDIREDDDDDSGG